MKRESGYRAKIKVMMMQMTNPHIKNFREPPEKKNTMKTTPGNIIVKLLKIKGNITFQFGITEIIKDT